VVELLKKGGFEVKFEMEGITNKNTCVKFSINPYVRKALIVLLYNDIKAPLSTLSLMCMRGSSVSEHFFSKNPEQLWTWGFDVEPFPAHGPLQIIIGHYLCFNGGVHNMGTVSHLNSLSGLSYRRTQ
jgi:hypothetical protein